MPCHFDAVLLPLQAGGLCWNGHPEILGIIYFSQPLDTFPPQFVCKSGAFPASDGGTEVSRSDDVA